MIYGQKHCCTVFGSKIVNIFKVNRNIPLRKGKWHYWLNYKKIVFWNILAKMFFCEKESKGGMKDAKLWPMREGTNSRPIREFCESQSVYRMRRLQEGGTSKASNIPRINRPARFPNSFPQWKVSRICAFHWSLTVSGANGIAMPTVGAGVHVRGRQEGVVTPRFLRVCERMKDRERKRVIYSNEKRGSNSR